MRERYFRIAVPEGVNNANLVVCLNGLRKITVEEGKYDHRG